MIAKATATVAVVAISFCRISIFAPQFHDKKTTFVYALRPAMSSRGLFQGARHLFRTNINFSLPNYVVSADGKKFLINERRAESEAASISVILNWHEELHR
jgi:hypothetical protein